MDKILVILGLLLMVFNLVDVIRLRSAAPGGIVGSRLIQLTVFISLFAAAYLAVGLLIFNRSSDTLLVLLTAILAGGAIFVLLVLRLVRAILEALEL